jgi:trans-aconitate methyltransferase
MSFDVSASAYDRFMGRYSEPLALEFLGVVEPAAHERALDVGCGPGALTTELVRRLGTGQVAAVDPTPAFVEACRQRLPGVEVQVATAEELPFADNSFDLALAQLVVHFMADPVAGLAEMGRVTHPGGVVAACVWDLAGGAGPLSAFWRAVQDCDPSAPGESTRAGGREGHLAELCSIAGLHDVVSSALTVRVPMTSFEDWWEPYTLGVGPAGAYLHGLDRSQREAVRRRAAELLPDGPFEVSATAWCVRARA